MEIDFGEDYNEHEVDPLDPEYMAYLKRFKDFGKLRDLTLGSYHFWKLPKGMRKGDVFPETLKYFKYWKDKPQRYYPKPYCLMDPSSGE